MCKDKQLQLKKSGPIYAINYSLTGDKFVTIAGQIPPSVAINFDKIGTQFEIGQFPYNSIRYSCLPNLVAIGGFGNFTGDIQVFDIQTRQTIGEGNAQYTSEWGWSPCGRLLLSAVLYPKMMVSNEFRIYNHLCQKLYTMKATELTQCEWVGITKPMNIPKIVNTQPKTAPVAYIPPHLRAQQARSGPKNPPGFSNRKR